MKVSGRLDHLLVRTRGRCSRSLAQRKKPMTGLRKDQININLILKQDGNSIRKTLGSGWIYMVAGMLESSL